MTKEERLNKIAELKEQAKEYKRLSDFYIIQHDFVYFFHHISIGLFF